MNGFFFGLMGHDGMHPFGFFPFGLINASGSLLLLAGVVVLAVWAFRAIAGRRQMPAQTALVETPHDILARRLAGGEISAEEYQRARDVLGGSPPPPPPS